MCKGERLRKNSQFTTVYTQGRTWVDNLVVLKALPNGLEWNRYGFVAGKRMGKAVVRNRMKRLFREVARSTPTAQGWDIIFIGRNRAARANYHQIEEAVRGLLRRARILADRDSSEGMGKTEE